MKKLKLHPLSMFIVVIALLKLLHLVILNPHGRWDAWAIWNRAAIFLYHNSPDLYSTQIPHPDYPLLLPFLVTLGWRLIGSTSPIVPMVLSLLFIIGLTLTLYLALKKVTTPETANLLVILLIVSPAYFIYGASQMADIPLAFFMLVTVVCLLFYEHKSKNQFVWILAAGVSAGLALHTKNEGALFVLVLLPYVLFAISGNRLKQISIFLLGLLPFVLLYMYMKLSFAPPNDIISGATDLPLIDKLTDINRYFRIAQFLIQDTAYYILVTMLALILMLSEPSQQLRWHKILVLPLIILLGYSAIYLITPHDLVWHLDSSLDRLISHLAPLWLLGIGLSVQAKHDESR